MRGGQSRPLRDLRSQQLLWEHDAERPRVADSEEVVSPSSARTLRQGRNSLKAAGVVDVWQGIQARGSSIQAMQPASEEVAVGHGHKGVAVWTSATTANATDARARLPVRAAPTCPEPPWHSVTGTECPSDDVDRPASMDFGQPMTPLARTNLRRADRIRELEQGMERHEEEKLARLGRGTAPLICGDNAELLQCIPEPEPPAESRLNLAWRLRLIREARVTAKERLKRKLETLKILGDDADDRYDMEEKLAVWTDTDTSGSLAGVLRAKAARPGANRNLIAELRQQQQQHQQQMQQIEQTPRSGRRGR